MSDEILAVWVWPISHRLFHIFNLSIQNLSFWCQWIHSARAPAWEGEQLIFSLPFQVGLAQDTQFKTRYWFYIGYIHLHPFHFDEMVWMTLPPIMWSDQKQSTVMSYALCLFTSSWFIRAAISAGEPIQSSTSYHSSLLFCSSCTLTSYFHTNSPLPPSFTHGLEKWGGWVTGKTWGTASRTGGIDRKVRGWGGAADERRWVSW